jgi:hypothetical protein
MNTLAMMVNELMQAVEAQDGASREMARQRERRSRGLAHPGSVTFRVYRELLCAYPHALQAWQLRSHCRAGRGAVAWAVRFLKEIDRIECLPDDGRHLHYLRYRARL